MARDRLSTTVLFFGRSNRLNSTLVLPIHCAGKNHENLTKYSRTPSLTFQNALFDAFLDSPQRHL